MAKSKGKNVAGIAKRGKPTTKAKPTVSAETAVLENETVVVELTAEERDELARKKVDELVGSIDILGKNNEQEKPEKEVDKGSIEWLSDQVSFLSDEREKLRKELAELKEVVKTKESSNIGVNEGLIKFCVELEDNMTGRNKQRTAWKDVKIAIVLKTLNDLFPYTKKVRRG